jgi:hypothetical protein
MNQQLIELAKAYKRFKLAYAEQEAALDQLDEEWKDLTTKLQDLMIEEGVKSITIEGVGMLSMRTTSYPSVNAASKPVFFDYLKKTGNDSILKLDVNPRTLGAFLKEHSETLITERMKDGMDEVTAREAVQEELKKEGVAFFVKRDIALKG